MSSTTESGEKAHAKYSASGSARWLNCPGSIALSVGIPPEPDSPYALEGTRAHECLEKLLRASVLGAREFKEACRKALNNYPRDMVDHCLEAALWIMGRHQLASPGSELLIETRVDSSPFTCPGQFGTLDAAVVDEFGTLVVIDFKYGAGIAVDPEGYDGRGNSQLIYYGLGLSYQYHHNFSDVELVVIQPRAWHPSGNTTRTHKMKMRDFLKWADIFSDGVLETKEKNPRLASGSWCKFCPAGSICPELKGAAMKKARISYSDKKGIEAIPEPKLIKADELGTMLDACDQLEAWIEKVRTHAWAKAKKGETITGWKLVEQRPRMKWANEPEAIKDAERYYRRKIFDEMVNPPELKTPLQVKKVLEKAGLTSQWVENRVREETEIKTVLVRDSDRRLPVKKEMGMCEGMFQTIEVTPERKGATAK